METVQDVQDQLSKKASGSTDGRILFQGKRLEASQSLSDAGVKSGDQLSVVPSKKGKSAGSTGTDVDPMDAMQDYLKSAGVDPEKLKEMAGGEGMPSMEESMSQMQSMMQSPIFKEYMNDPEKLEQSRQMILQNPMLKNMMAGMPGMAELLEDPDAWREAMKAAANLYQNMDSDTLMKTMMGGGGPPSGGLFDGTLDSSTAAAALDELDEED